MPVENEFKYILDDPNGRLEALLRRGSDVTATDIVQGYLNDDTRIRRITDCGTGAVSHVFSFKKKVAGRSIEIETEISEADFRALWPERQRGLRKRRFTFQEGDIHWDVDFLRSGRSTYFVLAEAEVAEDVLDCPEIADRLDDFLLHVAGSERGFSSRRLCDEAYAGQLLKVCRKKRADRDQESFQTRPFAMAC